MVTKKWIGIVFLLISFCSFPQDNDKYISLLVNSELKEHSNAIIRKNDITLDIQSIDKMHYTQHRIITVLNKSGDDDVNAYVFYNESTKIKKLEARIYDQFGNQIKKIKSKDFNDVSAVDGGTLYSDDRLKYLDYTPISYPYTVDFYVETSTKNTAGLPKWRPLEGYYISTEESKITVFYTPEVGLQKKEENFEGFPIQDKSSIGKLQYEATHIPAINYEAYSPLFSEIAPLLKIATKKFYYEGYFGENSDWNSLGQWMYNELISNRLTLPQTTKDEVLKLTANAASTLEKAKLVYEYVQDKTRYISVQEGIGGIQPIKAMQVDNVKYGDCKGLSNYTKALLDVVGVKANYTRVFASPRNTVDIDKDFVTFVGQTNHVILNIPQEGEDIWLECTSQTSPFNYSANFTDDRDVFVLSPEGGKIVHTKTYTTQENLQDTKATITLSDIGGFIADVTIQSKGTQYGYHQVIEDKTTKDQELSYKDDWDYLNNLEIKEVSLNNNKNTIVFTENLKLKSQKYASKTAGMLLFAPNIFNRIQSAPPRYKNRTLPFVIERGFVDTDTYEIVLPEGFEVEALQEPKAITNMFGEYHFSIEQKDAKTLIFKRKFILNKGTYSKENYKDFRKFWLQIVRQDKSRIVIKKTS